MAAAKGCWTVDAPVSGGDAGARDGTLAILAGGNEGVVRWLSPLFEKLGSVTWMGPAGNGQSSKIANQIAISGTILGLSEAMVFAERAALVVPLFLDAVRCGAAGSRALEIFGKRMTRRDFAPGGLAEYVVKDLGMGLRRGGEGEGNFGGGEGRGVAGDGIVPAVVPGDGGQWGREDGQPWADHCHRETKREADIDAAQGGTV